MNEIEYAKRILCHYFRIVDTEKRLDSDCFMEIESIIDNIVDGIKKDLEKD